MFSSFIKKIPIFVLVLFCLVLSTEPAQSQEWIKVESDTNTLLRDVFFANSSKGWVVGNSGTILHTKDSGQTWVKQTSGTKSSLHGVYFLNSDLGWIVGENGTFLETKNGGKTWVNTPDMLLGETLNTVYFINSNKGWIVDKKLRIYSTEDGGSNWRLIRKNLNKNLKKVHFYDNKTWWAVGSLGIIYKTSNAGLNWEKMRGDADRTLTDIHFTTTDIGYASAWAGTILYTDDSSKVWESLPSGTNDFLNGIFFLDPVTGWAVGDNGTILYLSSFEFSKQKYPEIFQKMYSNNPQLFKPKTQFETTDEYNTRRVQAEKLIRTKLITKFAEIERKTNKQILASRKEITLPVTLENYDADQETYSITINDLTKDISLPRNEAQKLYQDRKLIKAEGISQLTSNLQEREVFNINIVHPITGQKYPFGPQIELDAQDKQISEPVSQPPNISISDPTFKDTNGDNRLGAGESATISFTIKNNGEGPAQNLQITGNTSAQIEGLNAQIGNIPTGEERSISLTLTGQESIRDGEAEIQLNFQEAAGFEPAPIRLVIPTLAYRPPELLIAEIAVEDDLGRGVIEPGSVITITTRIQNTGKGTAENVQLSLNAGENIFLNGREQGSYSENIGRLEPGEWRDVSFEAFSNNRADEFKIAATITESKGEYGVSNQDLGLEMNEQQLTIRELEIQGREIQQRRDKAMPSLSVDIEKDIPKTTNVNNNAIAVIIGNQNYRGDTPDVTYAIRDVSMMRRYLQSTFGFKAGNILYYENASLGDMRTVFGTESSSGRLHDLVRKDQSDVFVFYSGHGAPSTDEGSGYLMPVDGNASNLEATGYNLELLYDNLSKLNSRSTTVVVDACFSGASGSGEMLIEAASPIGIRVNNPAATLGDDAVVVSAASGSQIASWHTENRYGLLTYYFLKGVKGDADLNEDKKITVGELRAYLTDSSDGLPYTARALHSREQTPQVFGDDNRVILQLE